MTSLSQMAPTVVQGTEARNAAQVKPDSNLKFQHQGITIRHDTVDFCVSRIYSSNAAFLHAVEDNSNDDLHIRHRFIAKFRQKVKTHILTQQIFDTLISTYFSFSESDEKSSYQKNGQIIFKELKNLADRVKNIEAYAKACFSKEYCFTKLDFPLIAAIFERNICIYSSLGELAVEYGTQYKEKVILIDNSSPGDLVYTRFIPQPFLQSLKEKWISYTVTSPKANEVFSVYSQFCASFRQNAPHALFQLILDYAEIDLQPDINAGMQSILDRENWELSLQSFQNWKLCQTYHTRVTHLNSPSGSPELNKRVETVICSTLFPKLTHLHFGNLPSAKDYLAILVKNPNIQSLVFDSISVEDFYEIFKALPQLAKRLTSLAVNLKKIASLKNTSKYALACASNASHEETSKTAAATTPTLTWTQLFQPLMALQSLSIKFEWRSVNHNEWEDELETVLLSMHNLYYLDLNGIKVTHDFVPVFINDRLQLRYMRDLSKGITAIDMSVKTSSSALPNTIRPFPNEIVIKNYSSTYAGMLTVILKPELRITKLNLSGALLSYNDQRALLELADSLEYLDLSMTKRHVLVDDLANLRKLTYLDITGWKTNDMIAMQKLRDKGVEVIFKNITIL